RRMPASGLPQVGDEADQGGHQVHHVLARLDHGARHHGGEQLGGQLLGPQPGCGAVLLLGLQPQQRLQGADLLADGGVLVGGEPPGAVLGEHLLPLQSLRPLLVRHPSTMPHETSPRAAPASSISCARAIVRASSAPRDRASLSASCWTSCTSCTSSGSCAATGSDSPAACAARCAARARTFSSTVPSNGFPSRRRRSGLSSTWATAVSCSSSSSRVSSRCAFSSSVPRIPSRRISSGSVPPCPTRVTRATTKASRISCERYGKSTGNDCAAASVTTPRIPDQAITSP